MPPSSDPAVAAAALEVQKTATQIVTLINNVAEAAGGSADAIEAVKAAVLNSLVESVQQAAQQPGGAAAVDLSSVAAVQAIVQKVAEAVPELVSQTVVEQSVNTVAAINQSIESATSAGGIAQTVVQLEAPERRPSADHRDRRGQRAGRRRDGHLQRPRQRL